METYAWSDNRITPDTVVEQLITAFFKNIRYFPKYLIWRIRRK